MSDLSITWGSVGVVFDPLAKTKSMKPLVAATIISSSPAVMLDRGGRVVPAPVVRSQGEFSTPWLRDLRSRLQGMIELEAEITVQVAVMLASKMSKQQVMESLGISDLDFKKAKERLTTVAMQWESE